MGRLFSSAEAPHADQRAGPLFAHALAKDLSVPAGAAADHAAGL